MCGLKVDKLKCLTAKAVQGTSLPLQCVYNVKGGDCFAASVLCVCDCIPDNILQEHLYIKDRQLS